MNTVVIDNCLLEASAKHQAKNYLLNPSSAVMITGAPGSGKFTLAKALSAELLQTGLEDLERNPNYTLVGLTESKTEIPISAIREVRRSLSLKRTSYNKPRIVLIHQADKLSLEAQNALLKTLEEPNAGSHFILTAPSMRSVLPTISSRTWRLHVNSISLDDALRFFSRQYGEDATKQAWYLSQGSAGLTKSLLLNEHKHPLRESTELAKQFLRAGRYERLLIADKLAGDKQAMELFFDGASRLLRALHQHSVAKGAASQRKLFEARKFVNTLKMENRTNANSRLIALSLALNLKL